MLHEIEGTWKVAQKIWSSPDAKPMNNEGTMKYEIILGGRAALMTTTIPTSGYEGVSLITFNPRQGEYHLAYLDTISDQGIVMMGGLNDKRSSHDLILAEFSPNTTQERVWGTSILAGTACLPGDIAGNLAVESIAPGGFATMAERVNFAERLNVDQVQLRVTEHKVSDNQWVLEFHAPASDGQEFLVQQNVFTRDM